MNSTILRMHISAPKAIKATKVVFMNDDNLSQKELEGIFNAVKFKSEYQIYMVPITHINKKCNKNHRRFYNLNDLILFFRKYRAIREIKETIVYKEYQLVDKMILNGDERVILNKGQEPYTFIKSRNKSSDKLFALLKYHGLSTGIAEYGDKDPFVREILWCPVQCVENYRILRIYKQVEKVSEITKMQQD